MNKLYVLLLASLITQHLVCMEQGETKVPLLSTYNKENEGQRNQAHNHYVSISIKQQQPTLSQECFSGSRNCQDSVVNLKVNDLSRLKEMLNIINKIRKSSQLKVADINLIITSQVKDFSFFDTLFPSERSQIRYLDLSNCGLQDLPRSVATLSELRHLTLDSNQITFKPTDFENFTELRQLSLKNNGISQLPMGLLSPLQNLEQIQTFIYDRYI
jgi:Leucine-rich repeat (LRR) protein